MDELEQTRKNLNDWSRREVTIGTRNEAYSIENHAEEADKFLAKIIAYKFIPHFDWQKVKAVWKDLNINQRFFSLTLRRVQLTDEANAVISREVLLNLKPDLELVFAPKQSGCTIRRSQIDYSLIKGNAIFYGQNLQSNNN